MHGHLNVKNTSKVIFLIKGTKYFLIAILKLSVQALKAYGVVEVLLCLFLNFILGRVHCSSSRTGRFSPGKYPKLSTDWEGV